MFLLVGISHQIAERELQGRIALSIPKQSVLKTLINSSSTIWDNVVFSTGGCTEIYCDCSSEREFDWISSCFSEVTDLNSDFFASQCYRLKEEQVVRHLFRGAAGLNSLIREENGFFIQLYDSFKEVDFCSRSRSLYSLFRAALKLGGKVRRDNNNYENSRLKAAGKAELIVERDFKKFLVNYNGFGFRPAIEVSDKEF